MPRSPEPAPATDASSGEAGFSPPGAASTRGGAAGGAASDGIGLIDAPAPHRAGHISGGMERHHWRKSLFLRLFAFRLFAGPPPARDRGTDCGSILVVFGVARFGWTLAPISETRPVVAGRIFASASHIVVPLRSLPAAARNRTRSNLLVRSGFRSGSSFRCLGAARSVSSVRFREARRRSGASSRVSARTSELNHDAHRLATGPKCERVNRYACGIGATLRARKILMRARKKFRTCRAPQGARGDSMTCTTLRVRARKRMVRSDARENAMC